MDSDNRELQPGESVAQYVVLRRAALGGHGALYKARHRLLVGCHYALKILHARHLRDSTELVTRMEREAQILAALRHENIVRVLDAGMTEERDGARPYVVMDWLRGRSLAYVLHVARGRGIGAYGLEIAIELADALEHAHGQGVIHRDLKPDNIFLEAQPDRSTRTKLLDFGVARVLGAERITQRLNSMVGTPMYASPEQIRGDDPSAQTDLYAFGLVLYELLTGRQPFGGRTVRRALEAHLAEAPPPLPERVHPQLARLVMECLEKDRARRPASASHVARVLREHKFAMRELEGQRAELAHPTDESPQDIVTRAGEATEPPRLPAARDTVRVATVHNRTTVRPPPTAGPGGETAVDPPRPVVTTLRMDLQAERPTGHYTDTDRYAATRSPAPLQARGPQNDTEPVSDGRSQPVDLQPVGDRWVLMPQGRAPAPRPGAGAPAVPSAASSSSAAVFTRPPSTAARPPLPPGVRAARIGLAIAAAALLVVLLVVAGVASRHRPVAHAAVAIAPAPLPTTPLVVDVIAPPTFASPPAAEPPAAPSVESPPAAISPSSRPSPSASSARPSPRRPPAPRDLGEFKTGF